MGISRKLQDAFKEKSREISQSIGEKYRAHVGEELARREKELQAREAALNTREEELRRQERQHADREAKLKRFYLLPKSYVWLPLAVMALLAAAWAFWNMSPAMRSPASSNEQSATHASSSGPACVSLGTAYYKGIGSYPTLSSGEDADSKIQAMCAKSALAFGR